MATIADLNVRLGVINDITKGLQRVERDLRRSGQRLASLGSELSVSISAPLGLIGVSAIKAAADLESLELALQSQLGSAEAARKELDLLRQSALAPGLGFEQAVRGSVTLQAVGLSAEEARKTIEQFGNGLAIAGKGAGELDGVITALSQISSKGVVSAEEINQIAERLPQIRTLMQQAFGTSNTENIQALKISSEDFIRSITKELEKLPRATGGIKNSIENAGDAIKQFLGNLGQEINKTFNLTKVAEDLSKSLKGAAQAFGELDADTKKAIITAGAFLVALGPVIKILGVVQLTLGQGAGLLASFGGALKQAGAAAIFAANNIRLSLVVATGGLLAVLGLVTAAVFYFSDSLNATTFAQEAFADASQTVTEQTAQQTAALNANFAVLLNTNSGYDQRKKAIDALQAAYPEYLKGIDLEKASNIELEAIQQKVNRAILQGVAERQKAAAVNKIYEEQAKILLRIQEIQRTGQVTVKESTLIDTGDLIKNGSRAAAVIEKLQAQVNGLSKQAVTSAADFDKAFNLQGRAIDLAAAKEGDLRQAYQDREEAAREALETGAKIAETDYKAAGAAQAAAKATEAQEKALRKATKAQEDKIEAAEKEAAINARRADVAAGAPQGIPTLATPQGVTQEIGLAGGEQTKKALESLKKVTTDVGFSIAGTMAMVREGTLSGIDALNLFADNAKFASEVSRQAVELLASGVQGVFDGIGSALGEGAVAFSTFAKAALNGIIDVVAGLIKLFVAQLLVSSSTFFAANPFVALAVGGAVAALGAGLFKRLVGGIKPPKLAKGGLAFGPTTAIVGDNPGARSNPEVIAPLDKLKSFINPQPSGGIVGEYSIRGQDLLVVLKRAEVSNQRITGNR